MRDGPSLPDAVVEPPIRALLPYDKFTPYFTDGIHIGDGAWPYYDIADGYGDFPEIELGGDPQYSAYAVGRIADCMGCDIYIVRFVYHQHYRWQDALYVYKGGQPVQVMTIGRCSRRGEGAPYDQSQSWRFDTDTLLHVRTRNDGMCRDDRDLPCIREHYHIWEMTSGGFAQKSEDYSILYAPQTYEQFKAVFNITGARFAPWSEFVAAAWEHCDPNRDNLYAGWLRQDAGGLDLFFLHSLPRCQEPWAQGTIGRTDFMEAFRTDDPDHKLYAIENFGTEMHGDAVAERHHYNFEYASSFSSTAQEVRQEERYGLLLENHYFIFGAETGFDEPIDKIEVTRYTFNDGTLDRMHDTPVLRSAMFEADMLDKIEYDPKYPTPDNPCRFWRAAGNQFELGFWVVMAKSKPCFYFVTRTADGRTIGDAAMLAPGVPKIPISAVPPKDALSADIEFIIRTSNGSAELRSDGTFRKITP